MTNAQQETDATLHRLQNAGKRIPVAEALPPVGAKVWVYWEDYQAADLGDDWEIWEYAVRDDFEGAKFRTLNRKPLPLVTHWAYPPPKMKNTGPFDPPGT